MLQIRNYWVYSGGLAVVWAIVLAIAFTIAKGNHGQTFLLVFFGFFLGWVSGTIARYVYAPPKKWMTQ
jgi:hypothetical protein